VQRLPVADPQLAQLLRVRNQQVAGSRTVMKPCRSIRAGVVHSPTPQHG
jgi:hypothetical protein